MSSPLGPIEILCDAPPYPIVRAGHRIGLLTPEDVRWCRMSRFLKEHAERPGGGFHLPGWKLLLGMGRGPEGACTCGQKLPLLERYTFTFRTGEEVFYLIGQCGRCRTVFWDEA